MLRKSAVIVMLGSLAACVSNPPVLVPDSAGNAAISAVGMTCSKPYELVKDCSGLSGPTREISLSGLSMKVAGSDDGRVIVVFGTSSLRPNMQEINTSFEIVKGKLGEQGVALMKVTPVVSSNILFGYAIEVDKPAYDDLVALTE